MNDFIRTTLSVGGILEMNFSEDIVSKYYESTSRKHHKIRDGQFPMHQGFEAKFG